MGFAIAEKIDAALQSGSDANRQPIVRQHNESNVRDMFVIGDLAGAPVIKLAMDQGYQVIRHIASLPDGKGNSVIAPARERLCKKCFRNHPAGGEVCEGCGVALGTEQAPERYDVIIAGAGAAGLNAALQAKEEGLSYLVLEKGKIANTIENFPEGKWIYAEPDQVPPKGKLWLDGARKEDLISRWQQIIRDDDLHIHVQEGVTGITKTGDDFTVSTVDDETGEARAYHARRIVIAIGQRGNPRKLKVEGEDQEAVYHRLYSPKHYEGEDILIVGGGNSAVEAALTLCERNRVTISYRGGEFARIFKDNERLMNEAIRAGKIKVAWHSEVISFGEGEAVLRVQAGGTAGDGEEMRVAMDHAFVLIGAELPVKFLKSIGIRLENEWEGRPGVALGLTALPFVALAIMTAMKLPEWSDGARAVGGLLALLGPAGMLAYRGSRDRDRYAWLGFSFVMVYSIYGMAKGLWPYPFLFNGTRGGYIIFLGRGGPFWYTAAYSIVMTVFGIAAMKRWGFDRKDKFQIARYCSLLAFQWIFFFIIPEFTWEFVISKTPTDAAAYVDLKSEIAKEVGADMMTADVDKVRELVAARLQADGWDEARIAAAVKLGDERNAWRAYSLIYAWPLFSQTFFGDPHVFWAAWGAFLSFILIPLIVIWQGKRYCSWVCGCGGLAETLGDRWRHLAPKGAASIRAERVGTVVLGIALVMTVGVLAVDALKLGFASGPAEISRQTYSLLVDVWMAGILPVTLYPFLGGKVWCRMWCPLAKMMQFFSFAYTKFGISRFGIAANDKCIACGECTRYCQVGIPVMQYALKQETLDNETSSCIGCGICVSVCPMDTLSFATPGKPVTPTISARAGAAA